MAISVSIIIPTRERLNALSRCLSATVKQLTDGDEIIVVENDKSNQQTKQIINVLAKKYAVRYAHKAQLGPSFARNKGISLARGEVLVFLDDDCVPKLGWLKAIKKRHENEGHEQKPRVFQGKINYVYEKSSIIVELFHLRNQADWQVTKKTPGWKMGKFINFLNAGIFSVRKEILVKNKIKFNEKLFPFVGEERELTAQLHLHGIPIVYAPEIQVTHYKKKGSLLASLKRSFQMGKTKVILDYLYQTKKPTIDWFGRRATRSKNKLVSKLLSQFGQRPCFVIVSIAIVLLKSVLNFFGELYGKMKLPELSAKDE